MPVKKEKESLWQLKNIKDSLKEILKTRKLLQHW
jgi:hypothetical protein